MDDYYDCEPLNLVKKKPKPVAVVAPSAVVESGVGPEEEEEEEDGKVEDLSVKKSSRIEDEKIVEDVNKNCFWEKSSGGGVPASGSGVYGSMMGCEPSFLTALYLRSLVSTGVIPQSYLASYPLYPPAPRLEDPLWAQHRFWQMVQAQKTSPQESTTGAITDSLTIKVPPLTANSGKKASSLATAAPPALTTSTADKSPHTDKEELVRTKKPKQKRSSSMDHKNSSLNDGKSQDSGHTSNNQDKKKPHIKKPLNAFMLYMKEMRAKVVAECTLKESAAINQILGRRWHSLTREEQAKYYEKARQERQLHMELYPGWSARDNYGYGAKKKKRKKERVPISDSGGRDEQAKYYELARRERQLHMQLYPDWSSRANTNRGKKRKRKQEPNDGGNSMKKCRARYGLDQQSQWCKPCRRKKKCIRYMECGDDGNQSEDNLGSCGSVGEAQTSPDDDGESLQQSMSSPGGLSGLSSLTSPGMILPSPSASLASPSVSLASPCMSLQSPLTPHQLDYECGGKPPPPPPPCLPLLLNHQLQVVPPHRNPVGTNPHDINNPLSVNQLTGKCIKNSSPGSAVSSPSTTGSSKDSSRPVISVT